MERQKICRNCIYCPCTKVQCKLDGEACNDFVSVVQDATRKIDEKYG